MKNTILILIPLLFLTGCTNKYVEVIKESPYTERVWETYGNGRDGQKRYEIIYKDGYLDGPWVGWYENGQKKYEGNYKNDRRDGLWTYWDEVGNVTETGTYKDGEFVKP